MITVGYLKRRLAVIPDDALAYAYEGEVTGIVIKEGGSPSRVIHAGEGGDLEDDQKEE